MKKLLKTTDAFVDMSVVFTLILVFAALMVIGYIMWVLPSQLIPSYPTGTPSDALNASQAAWNASWNNTRSSFNNITGGYDSAVSLILVAITIFILAIAIGALLLIRGRQ